MVRLIFCFFTVVCSLCQPAHADFQAKTVAQQIVGAAEAPDKITALAVLLKKYSWLDREIFHHTIMKEITFSTDAALKVRLLPMQGDRAMLLRWQAISKPGEMVPQWWCYADLSKSEEVWFLKKYHRKISHAQAITRAGYLQWLERNDNISALLKFFPEVENLSRQHQFSKQRAAQKAIDYHVYLIAKKLVRSGDLASSAQLITKLDNRGLQPLQIARWWRLRHILARDLLDQKQYNLAYTVTISCPYNASDVATYSDAHWLAGWISLSFLHKPQQAIGHFQQVYQHAQMSDTKAKAAYWLFKAYQGLGDKQQQSHWLHLARSYRSFFYGQLAALQSVRHVDNPFEHTSQHGPLPSSVGAKRQFEVACQLLAMGKTALGQQLMLAVAKHPLDSKTAGEMVAKLAKITDVDSVVLFSKALANYQNITLKLGYPMHFNLGKHGKQQAFYYAIARQESNFNHRALSPAGAFGLMQLMPQTARRLSKRLGLHHQHYRRHPHHNIACGALYFKMLKEEFASNIIALAAYNAGEGNARNWQQRYGEARTINSLDRAVHWIESISFGETRFYVKKVLANAMVYHTMLATKDVAQVVIS